MTEKTLHPIALEERAQMGARLTSPSAERNKDVIAATLADHLPQNARVLEIAAGTGQHGLAAVTVRPDLSWHPTDPDPTSRASQDSWALEAEGRIKPSRPVDTTKEAWWSDYVGEVDSLYCANMIHIAPWDAGLGLLKGAGAILGQSQGVFMLYGPFQEGAKTAPSNLDFDASLKSRDARWGVRALDQLLVCAEKEGLGLSQRIEMPANNLMLKFKWARS